MGQGSPVAFTDALKSRHVILALLVAPLLAMVAWFAVGHWVAGEAMTLAPATQGSVYPLLERSGCRYAGGRCVLSNGDLNIEVTLQGEHLYFAPSVDVDVLIAGLIILTESVPVEARWRDKQQAWEITLAGPPSADDRLRVIVSRNNSKFYGEASMTFIASEDLSSATN